MTKILLTGINGQLGRQLTTSLTSVGEVIAMGRDELDLTQPKIIASVVEELKPDIIVNPAAYTAVDKAETEVELATQVNGIAPGVLADSAKKVGALLVHVSTDYVFGATQNTPYQEDDIPKPLGIYGSSKLQGEKAIAATGIAHYIVRTSWVYSHHGNNFVKTMLRFGAQRSQIGVVVDQIGSPTWVVHLANSIVALLSQSPNYGIYHYTNSGVCSWYDFAVAIFEEARLLGFPLVVEKVIPISTIEYPTPAKRPAYSVLSNRKITTVMGDYPPHWRCALREMLKLVIASEGSRQ